MGNERPHIGLYLSARPEAGGIYQYALSLLDALASMDPSVRTTCFVEDEEWRARVPAGIRVVHGQPSPTLKGVGRIIRWFSFRLRNRLAPALDVSVRNINRSDCDLVIFPSQDSLSYQVHKPSLTTIHDLMHRYERHFAEYGGGVFRAREVHYGEACNRAVGVLVDSNLGKEQVVESYNVDPEMVHILPFVPPHYLLDCTDTDVRRKYQLPDRFLFYPAQFWEHKNHNNLLRAITILRARGVVVHLVLIGASKNNSGTVQQYIQENELDDQVSVLGYVPLDDMFSFYKHASAMVFPSLAGPTNIPPMEAMMLGCPAIVSDAYAMPEQVGSGALLMDAKDPADIAEKITQVLNSPELREVLVRKGHEQAAKWGQADFSRRLEEIIQRVIAE